MAWFTWIGASCISYTYCQYLRRKEKAGVRQMRELMVERQKKIEAKKEARRKAKEEHDRLEEERRKEEERKSWGYWFNKNVRFW